MDENNVGNEVITVGLKSLKNLTKLILIIHPENITSKYLDEMREVIENLTLLTLLELVLNNIEITFEELGELGEGIGNLTLLNYIVLSLESN